MYKRHTGQVSMLETPEMFGSLPLDPKNAAACDDGNVEAVVLPELNGLIEKIRNH